jgi:hypothetical protein
MAEPDHPTMTLEAAFELQLNQHEDEQFQPADENASGELISFNDDYNSVGSDYVPEEEDEDDDDELSFTWDEDSLMQMPLPRHDTSQFFRGFIPRELTDRQEAFYRQRKMDKRYYTGQQWATNLIIFQWKAARDAWQQRCRDLHATEASAESTRERLEAVTRIKAMYSQAHLVNAMDRRACFDVPIEDRLEMNTRNLKAWVQQMRPIIQKAIEVAHKQAVSGLRDIRQYLLRVPPAPNDHNDLPREAADPIATGVDPVV